MQEFVVALIVAVAALSLVWRFMPGRWKQRLARIHPALAPAAKEGGCGSCSACGGDSCSDTR